MARRKEPGDKEPTGVLTVQLEKDVLDRLLTFADVQCGKNPDRYPSRNACFVHKLTLASEHATKVGLEKHGVPITGFGQPRPQTRTEARKANPMDGDESLIPISHVRRYYNLSQREVLARLARHSIQAMANDAGEECIHARALVKLLQSPK